MDCKSLGLLFVIQLFASIFFFFFISIQLYASYDKEKALEIQ
jgi:hypothetical protein